MFYLSFLSFAYVIEKRVPKTAVATVVAKSGKIYIGFTLGFLTNFQWVSKFIHLDITYITSTFRQ